VCYGVIFSTVQTEMFQLTPKIVGVNNKFGSSRPSDPVATCLLKWMFGSVLCHCVPYIALVCS